MDKYTESENIDSNGNINPQYYLNATLDIIHREAEQASIDLSRITTNQLKSLLRICYHSIYEPKTRKYCNYACDIPYTTENIQALINVYIEICERFCCFPSLVGFERYTGITDESLKKYVTSAGLAILKQRMDYVQNAMANTPVGLIALANNDTSVGLMYNRQNMVENACIKQGLSFNDLKPIEKKE